MILINDQRIKVTYFSNTETCIKDFLVLLKDRNNVIHLRYETEREDYKINDDLMMLYFVKKEIEKLGKDIDTKLYLWSMPYQRMDHENEGYLHTLPYAAEFINSLNFSCIEVIEPHSKKTEEYLKNAVMRYPVVEWLEKMLIPERNNTTHILFPDKGAYERYHDLINPDYNVCIFTKKRQHDTNEIIKHHISEGKITVGSTCFILDDICSSGKTLLDVALYAKICGAARVKLIVGHCEHTALLSELLTPDSPVDMMYTSKSMISREYPKIHYMD